MYREQQLATMFTVFLSALCFIVVFVCYWYPVYSAIVVWSVISTVIGFALVKNRLGKMGLSFTFYAFFIFPLVLSTKNVSMEETLNILVFAVISGITVTFSAILLQRMLRKSLVLRVFQLAKRLIRARRMRTALSLLTISVYAASTTFMSSALQPMSLFFLSGIVICVIMNAILSDIYQKKNEFLTLAIVGLNPDHFVGLVLAEALIMSFIGGGIGYSVGFWIKYLTTSALLESRLLFIIMVEVILISNMVGFMASIIPASKASMMMTPSLLKRWWRETSPTSGWPPKWTLAIPVKVTEDNVEDFLFYYMQRLPFSKRFTENIESVYDFRLDYPDLEQSDQKKTWKLSFKYMYGDGTIMLETANDLIASKSLENDEIKITLTMKVTDYNDPQFAQRMDKYLEKIASEFRMFAFEWTKEKLEDILIERGSRENFGLNKSLAVFLIFLLFLSLSLWFIGNHYSLARNQTTHYVNFGVKWSHMGFFELDYTGSMWINGKIRVGENVSIAILHFSMTNINIEILDKVGLTFRIFLNQEADYPNRSKAITIETYHVFNSGQTLNSELYVMFNETLKFGNETVKITPGEELSLKGLYEFDVTRYFKNGDILTIPRQAGGGTETIIVENSPNPLLMFFLESIAEKIGQAGVATVLLTLGATAIIKRKRNR